ncbi:hypothetical protein QR680_007385 [Steinernema hermaphroditum]|uniref:F-box domain-containing protein n=1 Tax=Steinernema hermaphroditum TaxID=289476 RepID=A0AA39M631_9BILA|nr:hypothetical protein QR680_007385 [Steinernema hermaphroditum]
MDSLPYEFLNKVCISLPTEQLQGALDLDAPSWTNVVGSHLENRRYFDVELTVFFDGNGCHFKDGRFGAVFNEVDERSGALLEGISLDGLKAIGARFVKFKTVIINYCRHGDEAFHTNFEEVVRYVTARLDGDSCLRIKNIERNDVCGHLLDTLRTEPLLQFKKLELCTVAFDFGHKLLSFYMENNGLLDDLTLAEPGYWCGAEQREMVKRYTNRSGPKKLTLRINPQVDVCKCRSDIWVKLLHPDNEEACVLARLNYVGAYVSAWTHFRAQKKLSFSSEAAEGQCKVCNFAWKSTVSPQAPINGPNNA